MNTVSVQQVITHSELDQLREARDTLRHVARAITELSSQLDTRFCDAASLLAECRGSVVVTGMGKAGLIGRKLAATMSSTGTRSLFLHPAEAVHGDLGCVRSDDVVLALSNSGETEELSRLIPLLARIGTPIVAITARATSTLGRAAAIPLEIGALREACPFGLAPTTSTTAMLVLGDALALAVSRLRGFTREQFGGFHPAGSLGRQLQKVREVMRAGDQLRVAAATVTVREAFVCRTRPGRRTGAVILVDSAGRLCGLFTDSDLVRLLENRRESEIDRPIAEVMTISPKTISPDAPLADAIELLSKHHISELPVIDAEDRPVGLIDITDVISLMPEERVE